MTLPLPLPVDLQRMVDTRSTDLVAAFSNRDFAKVVEGHREMYTALFTSQPPGQRYHKGLPFQNIGAGLLFQGGSVSAYEHFVSAYVEDLLSRPPKHGGPPRDTPAAKTLLLVYGVPEDELSAFDRKVLRAAHDPELARDPQRLVRTTGMPKQTVSHDDVLAKAGVRRLEEPGRFPVPWENRVFVGGSYQSNFAVIREIARYVDACGRFPIIAADHRVVKGIHHHSLMLLHECRLAIFDISHEAGQMMEIPKALEYGVEMLVVRQSGDSKDLRMSSMLKGVLDQYKVDVRPFQTMAELQALVAEFLTRNP